MCKFAAEFSVLYLLCICDDNNYGNSVREVYAINKLIPISQYSEAKFITAFVQNDHKQWKRRWNKKYIAAITCKFF